MKQIFEESLPVEFEEICHRYPHPPELRTVYGKALTSAWYDKATGALVIEQAISFERTWAPGTRKRAEIYDTHAKAIRRVIALADAWQREVQRAAPTEPQDYEIDD